eukprot:1158372-Pelagomonas_calceolata.AAC.9
MRQRPRRDTAEGDAPVNTLLMRTVPMRCTYERRTYEAAAARELGQWRCTGRALQGAPDLTGSTCGHLAGAKSECCAYGS